MPTRDNPVQRFQGLVVYGSWHGSDAVRHGFRLMISLLLVTLVMLLLSLLFSFDALALRAFSSLLVVCGAWVYLGLSGRRVGQNDAAFSEIMARREQEGRAVAPKERERCFHPAKGYWIALLGALPFLLLALVFAFLARPVLYTLGTLPDWLGIYTHQDGIGAALHYYSQREGMTAFAVLRIVVRALIMPWMNVAVKLGDTATLWTERLAPLWVLIAPLGYGVGYAQGLKQRSKINASIAIGVQKKKRHEQKEHQARTRRNEPERLV